MFRTLLVAALCAHAASLDSSKNFLKLKEGSVHIAEWWGRLGNNLLQLQNALIYAEAKGKTRVTFPSEHGTELKQLINLPQEGIKVDPSNMKKKETCLRKPPFFYDDFFHAEGRASCFSDIKERRRVLVTYVKPLLQHPDDAFKTSEDELLIHLRSGDMMRPGGIKHPQTRQPPCAAYDKIIEEGNDGKPFEHVRIIGEHDHRNPCFDMLVQNHRGRNITVQEKPWLDDASAIINARNLVIGTSSFSLEIGLLNENLEKAWAAKQTITPEIVGCGYARQVNLMNVPGLEKIREYDERRKWMKSYKLKEVKLEPMCRKHDEPQV